MRERKPPINLTRRFTIGKKVTLGYGIIILITAFSSLYGLSKLRESRRVDQEVSEVYMSLLVKMDVLDFVITRSGQLISNWIYLPDESEKSELTNIHQEDFPALKVEVEGLMSRWTSGSSSKDSLQRILRGIEENLERQNFIMDALHSEESYLNDSLLFYEVIPFFDEKVEPGIKMAKADLASYTLNLQEMSDELVRAKNESLDRVESLTIFLTLLSIVLASIASYLVSKSITKPISHLNSIVQRMGKGELPSVELTKSRDEIADMARSIQSLRDALFETAIFAQNIGEGDLGSEYNVLSNDDVLGASLVSMRRELSNIISEMQSVVQMAGEEGNLAVRMRSEGKTGVWRELSESINNLLSSIVEPVLMVNEIVNSMADGDLTKRYDSDAKGDIRKLTMSLNTALTNLNQFHTQIMKNANLVEDSSLEMKVASDEMLNSTQEIATSISEMSIGTQNQVNKTDEVMELVEGILNFSKKMGKHSERINNAAKDGAENSSIGSVLVNNVVNSMTELTTHSKETTRSINVLSERSQQISQMLSVITDIASQTNLLALNAAIEAAQAGDKGRGFAVVAEEIRKLAENSKRATMEIEQLVTSVQQDTEQAVKVISTMNSIVEKGEKESNKVLEALGTIQKSSNITLDFSEEILEASKVQVKDIHNIVAITESVVVISEQTATGSEEVATSTSQLSSGMNNYNSKFEELLTISKELKDGVSRFKLDTEADDVPSRDALYTVAHDV